jgi:hypothetical protein
MRAGAPVAPSLVLREENRALETQLRRRRFVSPLLKFRQIGGSVDVGRAFVSAAAFEVKGTE